MTTAQITVDRHPEGGFVLRARQILPRRRDALFPFFSDAANLETITPPRLKFRILTPLPIDMKQGALIDYKLSLRGIPIRWQTHIAAWEPPFRFVDEQRRGPYRWWIHEHRFIERGSETEAIDEVRYGVPGGAIVNSLLVERDVRSIFEFRAARLSELFILDHSPAARSLAPSVTLSGVRPATNAR